VSAPPPLGGRRGVREGGKAGKGRELHRKGALNASLKKCLAPGGEDPALPSWPYRQAILHVHSKGSRKTAINSNLKSICYCGEQGGPVPQPCVPARPRLRRLQAAEEGWVGAFMYFYFFILFIYLFLRLRGLSR
jgi:hypothetical protein